MRAARLEYVREFGTLARERLRQIARRGDEVTRSLE